MKTYVVMQDSDDFIYVRYAGENLNMAFEKVKNLMKMGDVFYLDLYIDVWANGKIIGSYEYDEDSNDWIFRVK